MNRIALVLLSLLVAACARKEAPKSVTPSPPAATPPGTLAAAHPPATLAPELRKEMAAQHALAGEGPAEVGQIDVKRAEGPEGKRIAELFASKSELRNKEVAVRGKVVKVLHGIMGKTWIHLRDGSGTHEAKNDDLTVTTADDAAVGDVVLVRGRLSVDVDLGAGYVYPVLIEGAKVSKGGGS